MRADRRSGGIALLLAAGVAAGIPAIDAHAGYAGLSPRFLPTIVAIGLALCGAMLWRAPVALASEAPVSSAARTGTAWVIGGLLAQMLLIGWIGFVLAGTLLLVCVARGHGSRRPLRDAAVGLALTLPIWWLFSRLLGIGLPLLPLAGI